VTYVRGLVVGLLRFEYLLALGLIEDDTAEPESGIPDNSDPNEQAKEKASKSKETVERRTIGANEVETLTL